MNPKEGIHYSVTHDDPDIGEFVCLKCGKRIPLQYSYILRKQGRLCGTKQLMRLWAWNNFKKHLKACWEKKGNPEKKEDTV